MAPKILMADHSSAFRVSVKDSLEAYDCEFIEADNGKNGLSLAVSKRPDLIILDVNMPIFSGEEMLRKLKGRFELRDIPVIMVTTISEQSKVLEFAKLGINGYFVKPLKAQDLIRKVKEIIELHPKKTDDPEKGLSGTYFSLQNDVLLMKLPAKVTKRLAEELEKHLHAKIVEMTNAGILKFILDLREVTLVNIHLIRISIMTVKKCNAARRRFRVVGSTHLEAQFQDFNELSHVLFDHSMEEALAALGSLVVNTE